MKSLDSMVNSISNSLGNYMVKDPIAQGGGSLVFKVQSRRSKREYFQDWNIYIKKNIHRDLKPGNIIFKKNDKLKICDFGLATKLDDYETEKDTVCGTPNYISPEIIIENRMA
ncbi:protein kinase domain protein [Ichthyophthirius multifiliis]|uniref:Protein kinase domain protein n=1 Tax=Ichthyophthirius multifiliis TaxID=5932 RepID=G0R0E2_ICHMU|nr:protein kinase domain protein [Ichthyophthirius multifiliis]EGR29079.1 protein kinase domain protein [Ichthyophthirius multifiliis]|eukprot:XP_004030315.1 protein kinase domain protein [Ichthyophthirius multifiliis]